MRTNVVSQTDDVVCNVQQVFVDVLAKDDPLADGHIRSEVDVQLARAFHAARQANAKLQTIHSLEIRCVVPKLILVELFRVV